MARLPDRFLRWNYYPRRELVRRILAGEDGGDKLLLKFTRHTPMLVTAAPGGQLG